MIAALMRAAGSLLLLGAQWLEERKAIRGVEPLDITPWQCSCGLVARDFHDLDAHRLRNECPDFYRFECSLCQRRFATADDREDHVETSHGLVECKDCGNHFGDPLVLKEHKATCDGIPF